VVETHRAALARYAEGLASATHSISEDNEETIPTRCETVLNTTLAEMDCYHGQKNADFQRLTREHMDGEIAFYEQVLARLRTSRSAFENPTYEALGYGPRQPSMYERDLLSGGSTSENGHVGPNTRPPLPHPSPHVFDAAPMRPVTMALQDGVSAILGTGSAGRASVLGRLWA
jgi:sorting nexin-9/18/33